MAFGRAPVSATPWLNGDLREIGDPLSTPQRTLRDVGGRISSSQSAAAREVFAHAPTWHVIGAHDLTHDEIVRAVVPTLRRLACERTHFLKHDLVCIEKPAKLIRHALAASERTSNATLFDDVLRQRQRHSAEGLDS